MGGEARNFLRSLPQKMRVRWDSCVSESFSVCNGVRQGSILSPFLFAVYIDGLLNSCGVGCYWGCSFAGAFSYADDVVLLPQYTCIQ